VGFWRFLFLLLACVSFQGAMALFRLHMMGLGFRGVFMTFTTLGISALKIGTGGVVYCTGFNGFWSLRRLHHHGPIPLLSFVLVPFLGTRGSDCGTLVRGHSCYQATNPLPALWLQLNATFRLHWAFLGTLRPFTSLDTQAVINGINDGAFSVSGSHRGMKDFRPYGAHCLFLLATFFILPRCKTTPFGYR
jgi:hypothetical protein